MDKDNMRVLCYIPALVQMTVWRRLGYKPLSETKSFNCDVVLLVQIIAILRCGWDDKEEQGLLIKGFLANHILVCQGAFRNKRIINIKLSALDCNTTRQTTLKIGQKELVAQMCNTHRKDCHLQTRIELLL